MSVSPAGRPTRPVMLNGKLCTRCAETLPVGQFAPKKGGKFGVSSRCRRCLSALSSEWNKINRARIREYEANRLQDPVRQAKKREIQAHSDARHRVARRLAGAVYRASHREEAVRRSAEWRRANLERARELGRDGDRRYRARRGEMLPESEWRAVLERFLHMCAYCLITGVELTQEHLLPVSLGGLSTSDNVVPACRSCNSSKGARPMWVLL